MEETTRHFSGNGFYEQFVVDMKYQKFYQNHWPLFHMHEIKDGTQSRLNDQIIRTQNIPKRDTERTKQFYYEYYAYKSNFTAVHKVHCTH
jgi:hypothetical protein